MEKTPSRPRELERILREGILNLGCSVRLYNCLRNINKGPTIEEVLSISEKGLLNKKGWGKKTLRCLKAVLAFRGIPLNPDIYRYPEKYIQVDSWISVGEKVIAGEEIYKRLRNYEPFDLAIGRYHQTRRRDYPFIDYLRIFEYGSRLGLKEFIEILLAGHDNIQILLKLGYDADSIATIFHCRRHSVYEYAKKHNLRVKKIKRGIPAGTLKDQEKFFRIRHLLSLDYKPHEIAKISSTSRQAVHSYLIKHHLNTRS